MSDVHSGIAEAFAGRMTSMLNDAFLALMTSIGHQTGLFDTLADQRPMTSEDLAKAAGLDERYVRSRAARQGGHCSHV